MQKKIVSFFGPSQSSSKRRRAEDEDDISPVSNSESESDDDNTTRTSRSIATDVSAAYVLTVQDDLEDDSVCDNECCDSEHDKPYLPTSTEILKKSKGNCHFQRYWSHDHPWITYCISFLLYLLFSCL